MSSETKVCQNCKEYFTVTSEDFSFYEKIQVPAPTFCPQCRFQRRGMYRNDRKLFRGVSAMSGKPILSLFPPESGVQVYSESEWWSDGWDALTYGRKYDFSHSFFEQYFEFTKQVPRYNLDVIRVVRSDYSGNASDLKDCYLLFNSNTSENCTYGNAVDNSRNCIDNSYLNKCEKVYESFFCNSCYKTYFSAECNECSDVWFSKNCSGCNDCIGCVNLRNKSYHIFNQKYSKEDYEAIKKSLQLDTHSGMSAVREKAQEFWKKFPNKFSYGVKNYDSNGIYVTESKNVKNSYLIRGGENLKYCQYLQVPSNKECYDICVWGQGNELCYENCVCGEGVYNVKFSVECWPNVQNLEYCQYCKSSSDCFGCVGLRNKKYCIFNVQYSKEEYEILKEKIKQHMNEMPFVDSKGRVYRYGEFFPSEHAPYGYNNTIAQEHIPLSQKAAMNAGYSWIESSLNTYAITKKSSELSDSIHDVTDEILKEIIECGESGKAYRIVPEELQFLRAEGLPLPRTSIDIRHNKRIDLRLKNTTYTRTCDCVGESSSNGEYKNFAQHLSHEGACKNTFITGYDPEKGDIVYCEQCYQQEIV